MWWSHSIPSLPVYYHQPPANCYTWVMIVTQCQGLVTVIITWLWISVLSPVVIRVRPISGMIPIPGADTRYRYLYGKKSEWTRYRYGLYFGFDLSENIFRNGQSGCFMCKFSRDGFLLISRLFKDYFLF